MTLERAPDHCRKCGEMGFYYPVSDEETKPFKRINEHTKEIEAFNPRFKTPHWYVCSQTPKGLANSRRLTMWKDNTAKLKGIQTPTTAIQKTDNNIRVNYFEEITFPPDVIAKLIVKVQVIESQPWMISRSC